MILSSIAETLLWRTVLILAYPTIEALLFFLYLDNLIEPETHTSGSRPEGKSVLEYRASSGWLRNECLTSSSGGPIKPPLSRRLRRFLTNPPLSFHQENSKSIYTEPRGRSVKREKFVYSKNSYAKDFLKGDRRLTRAVLIQCEKRKRKKKRSRRTPREDRRECGRKLDCKKKRNVHAKTHVLLSRFFHRGDVFRDGSPGIDGRSFPRKVLDA